MELLMHAMCRATVELPTPVIAWMIATAHPLFQPWRALVRRPDLTDQQAWECLWRDDALIKSARKIPGKWTANATSEQLSDTVSLYLSRPDVPAGRITLLRTRLDPDQLHRLDLLRHVTELGGTDLVCQEIVAEPPPGSTRDEHVGPRELALIERYRRAAAELAAERESTTRYVVDQIVREDGLIARASKARSLDQVAQVRTLRACLFGRGSVAARPEDADFNTAIYLLELGRTASTGHDDPGLGEVLSALRPILRAFINPGYTAPRSPVTNRLLVFGEAGAAPLGSSISAEEGDYLYRRFGSSVSKYEALGKISGQNRDEPLRELCNRVEAAERLPARQPAATRR
ncbi:hypothetical protein [Williamsia soli]|uniref:hypothetical protein n=1 Tax=Williamsia soli TaxID=364929 RepID=UPI001A9E8504|nr:hypothetical protein [Williamsia soli]